MSSDFFLNLLILLAGLVTLVTGGDVLVRGASRLAIKLHISPLVVGLTIVAFGTSAPELLISVRSALEGSPDLAMGNVVGSNICNLALVLGIAALVNPVLVNKNSIKIDWPVTIGSSILLFLFAKNREFEQFEGAIVFTFLITYIIFIIRKSRKENAALNPEIAGEVKEKSGGRSSGITKDLLLILAGCLGLFYGSEWFVGAAQNMARQIGVSERVIGITVVALGTSLPELVTAAIASYKKESDLALGNLLGSNIFNIMSILGITSMITPIQVNPKILRVDMPWMIGITLLVFPMMLYKRKIGRINGAMLLIVYCYYTYMVLAQS
ncbi:calcium/sodium antiporter [Xanthovirga aplysinae]|uniref:calcium/sodium antiporter n=1 Tax=Xanthovirga aplysinae TaxID=2529853 RepID=UPI0012BD34E3|nr:calcium/sodium antiporter [Xanthovirga aplysinae]MTI32012.1 calcium/sodium antiporter [Xanthovirga aplysinae]